MSRGTSFRALSVCACAVGLALSSIACGGDDGDQAGSDTSLTLTQDREAAASPSEADFPPPQGRTMEEIAKLARSGPQVAPATAHYVVGRNRLAFGLLGDQNAFLYAPTAVYVGRTPKSKAEGPFLAPADSLVTDPAFRSQTAALEGDAIASIYSTDVELPRPGDYSLLVLTRAGDQLLGATGQLTVPREDPIPAPGERPPAIETDTLEDSGGQIAAIDTREPPDDMHGTDFAEVVGKRPVALLFATPALCESRVCGPVTDIAMQLKDEYGDRVEFIHQEVYVDNDPNKGLRPPLRAFNLETEPWLFTFDAQGRVAARLEGSFGIEDFEEALGAAL